MPAFVEFATTAGIEYVNVEARPEPEPDILCEFSSGEFVAFELTEAVESKVKQALSTKLKTASLTRQAFAALPEEERQQVLDRHTGKVIDVCSRDDALSLLRQRKELPASFKYLAMQVRREVGCYEDFDSNVIEAGQGLPSRLLDHLTLQCIDGLEGIHWEPCAFEYTPGDPISERFREKLLEKQYATERPMELAVYFDLHSPLPDDTGWIAPLRARGEKC